MYLSKVKYQVICWGKPIICYDPVRGIKDNY